MVNFDKCWKVANVIREVQQHQQVRYGTGPLRYGTGQQYRQVRYGTIEARQDVQARHRDPLRVALPPLAVRQQDFLPTGGSSSNSSSSSMLVTVVSEVHVAHQVVGWAGVR